MESQTLHGVIQGDTIQLDRPSDLPSGTAVRIIVIAEPTEKLPPGEGLRRSAGAWKDDDPAGLEAYLEWNQQQRKQSHRGAIEP